MKCKNNTFFNFWALFLKMYIFEAVAFFSRLVLIQSTQVFSASKVMILMKYFPSSNCCYDNWKSDIFVVPRKPLLRRRIVLSESYSLSIQHTVFLKKWYQIDKNYSKNIAKMYLLPHCIAPRTWNWCENVVKIIFLIFIRTCHIPKWIWFV